MKWLKKLDNPFLLGAQGFLAGAILFAATHPDFLDFQDRQPPAAQPGSPAAGR